MNVSAPPYPVVMTGTPQLIASCATRPHPSPRVGSTTAVAYVSPRKRPYEVVYVGEIGLWDVLCEDEVVRKQCSLGDREGLEDELVDLVGDGFWREVDAEGYVFRDTPV